MFPNDAHDDDICSTSGLRKKSRGKKIRDKWSFLYFVPLDVINYRSKFSGQTKTGPRLGVQLYRDLTCRVCLQVFHSRQILSAHSKDFHGRPSQSVNTNTRGGLSTNTVCEITIDDDEDEEEEITCLEPPDTSAASPLSSQQSLFSSALFQPEVSLSLSVTKAIRNADKESTEVRRGKNRSISTGISNIKNKFASLLVSGGKVKKQLQGTRENKEENRLNISSIKKTVIDWSAVLAGKGTKRASEGRKGDESPLILTDKAVQSPARKKAFRPKSLLNKFNEATGNSDGTVSSVEAVPRQNVSSLMQETDIVTQEIVTLDEEEDEADPLDKSTLDNSVNIVEHEKEGEGEEEDLILVEDAAEEEQGMMEVSECSTQTRDGSFITKLKMFTKKKFTSTPKTVNSNVIDFIDVF